MKYLIFAGVGIFFLAVLVWSVRRSMRGESSCGCDCGDASRGCCGQKEIRR